MQKVQSLTSTQMGRTLKTIIQQHEWNEIESQTRLKKDIDMLLFPHHDLIEKHDIFRRHL